MSTASSRQVGGEHYRRERQHWDLMWDLYGESYFEAQSSRYVDRHEKKAGRQDLEKAVHYAEKLAELQDAPSPLTNQQIIHIATFCIQSGYDPQKTAVYMAIRTLPRRELAAMLRSYLRDCYPGEAAEEAAGGAILTTEEMSRELRVPGRTYFRVGNEVISSATRKMLQTPVGRVVEVDPCSSSPYMVLWPGGTEPCRYSWFELAHATEAAS